MRIMLAGQIGRDAAMAERLAFEGAELHIAAQHENPSLVSAAERSGGKLYIVENIADDRAMGALAASAMVDLVWINQDNALRDGVIDEIRRQSPGTLLASPDSKASQIEADKFLSREIIEEIDPKYNPRYRKITSPEEAREAMAFFTEAGLEVAVKPRGLTGGKGVKVMGPHLNSYDEALAYALSVLGDKQQNGVLIEEKMSQDEDGEKCHEFTVQGLTDGTTIIVPPPTYDYPYREDGDKGPGIGGMGSFTMAAGELLPFLSQEDYDEAINLMHLALEVMKKRGMDFKGVLYGSFFKTKSGLKLVEFNGRIGCPEGVNIMELVEDDVSLSEVVLPCIARGELKPNDVRYIKKASTAIYLVAPDYGYRSTGYSYRFVVNPEAIAANGCRAYYAAARRIQSRFEDDFETVGSSRTMVLAALAETPWEAQEQILEAIKDGVRGPLVHRYDVGSKEYVTSLAG